MGFKPLDEETDKVMVIQAKLDRSKARPGGPKGKEGDDRSALIIKYAPLVKFLANRMAIRLPPSVATDDLISAGIMGLLDAIEKFDPGKEVQFKTYAEFRIKGAILDELRKMDWTPRSVRKRVREMELAIDSVEQRLQRPADDSEIAEELGVDLKTFYEMLDKARGIDLLSIDRCIDNHKDDSESNRSYKTLIRADFDPVKHIMTKEIKEVVANGIRGLPEKEQKVVSLYYYNQLTLKEIGQVLGLTESRISQIHTKAIIRLRARIRSYFET